MNEDISGNADLVQLILHAGDGDRVALDSLLARYRPYLRVIAEKSLRPLFGGRFDGSDIVQQTCYEAFRGIETLRGKSEREFNAWINRILRNNVANLRRDHTADKRDVRREEDIDIADSEISLQWSGISLHGRPESQVIKGEAALLLARTLEMLPSDQMTALQMRYLEMYTLAEVAEYMQVSKSSVARIVDRGLEALYDLLPEHIL